MRSYLAEIKELRKIFLESYKGGDFKKALFLGERLLELYNKNGNVRQPGFGEDFHNVAVIFDELGFYEKAAEYYCRAAELKKENKGESSGYADTLNNLAIVYSNLERHEEALDIHLCVLKVRGNRLGKNHMDYIHTLFHLGNIYESLKQYDKALESHVQALENSRNCRTLQIMDVADIHSSMARCYEQIGNYKKAIYYYEFALEIIEKKLSNNSLPYIINALSLAFVCEKSKLMGMAVEYCERAVEAHRRIFHQGHLDYVNNLNYLAALCYKDAQFDKSFQLNNTALEMVEKKFGQSHLLYFDILDRIALDLSGMKAFAKALEFGKKALRLREAFLPKAECMLVKSYLNLGKIMAEAQECVQALAYYKRALDILETDEKENKSFIADTWIQVACIFEQNGAYEGAAFLYENALKIKKSHTSANKELRISLMKALVQVRQKQEEETIAVLLCLEMEKEAREAFGKQHSKYGEVLRYLGNAYHRSGDLAMAGKYLEEALCIQRETLDEDSPIYVKTLEAFAEVCFFRGQYSRAMELYKEGNVVNFEETPEEQREAACTLLAIGNCCLGLGDKEKARAYLLEAEGKILKSGLMPNQKYYQLKEIYAAGKNGGFLLSKTARRRMPSEERRSVEDAIAFTTRFFQKNKDSSELENGKRAFAAFSIGEMYQRLGQKDDAVYWFTLAQKHAKPEYYPRTCTRLGEVYLAYGEEEKAVERFFNVKEYIAEYADTHSLENCRVLGYIGDYFYKKRETQTALRFYHLWNQLYKELNLPECASRDNRIIKIGKILMSFERYKEAMELYYVLAVSTRNREGETEKFSKLLLRVASLHVQLENVKEAETLLDHVLILAGKNGITSESFGKVCDKVGRLYGLAGLDAKALEALKLSYQESLQGKKCMTKEGIQLLCELLWKSGDSKGYFTVKNGHELE